MINPNSLKNLTYRAPKGAIPWNKGRKQWQTTGENNPAKRSEVRKKLSEAMKKRDKSYLRTKEVREKARLACIGLKRTQETKDRMRKAQLGKKHPWSNPPHYKGKDSPNWQGGKSFELYSEFWTDDLKESIRKRDNYICQMCGISQDEINMGQIIKLDIHHIDYCKNNLNPENLITLCRSCHIKTNFNRDYWIKKFLEFNKSNPLQLSKII